MILGKRRFAFRLHLETHHCRQEFLRQLHYGFIELLEGGESLVRRWAFTPERCSKRRLREQEQAAKEAQASMAEGVPQRARATCYSTKPGHRRDRIGIRHGCSPHAGVGCGQGGTWHCPGVRVTTWRALTSRRSTLSCSIVAW